ncbi:PilT-like protein [Fimbriimonas ginsengisoli Gsoil 348]|uniref:PilT-like protein n=1 Tax=Fimbriimonas ginsengisoli Gsoil 348 TaxID=661478 RepID=A0A068NMF8_FIMGI|nr:PilT-like protein [Fimbriimonas ginsengisoli Gsoil 348]
MITEPISNLILEKAIDLRALHGLKTPDAIHIATGLIAGCTVFITRDQAWAKAGVTVIEPQELG